MHRRALEFFGGAPKKILYDNLKSVVLHHVGSTIQFNPRFLVLAGHYLFEPTAPVRYPETKGRVETAIKSCGICFSTGAPSELRGAIAQLNPSEKSKRPAPMATEVASAVKRSGVKGVKVTVTKTRISLRAPLSGLNAIARELAELDVASG